MLFIPIFSSHRWQTAFLQFGYRRVKKIAGVQRDAIPYVHAVGTVLQNINHTGRRILACRNNRVQAERHLVYVGVVLDVVKQIEPELV